MSHTVSAMSDPFANLTREEAITKLREAWEEIEAWRKADDKAFAERQRHARETLRLRRRIEELEADLRAIQRTGDDQ